MSIPTHYYSAHIYYYTKHIITRDDIFVMNFEIVSYLRFVFNYSCDCESQKYSMNYS